ncbi:MAG: uncharacterized protein QOI56_1884, partial [Actinomycetota bacterium]|nr:uncharacterized protein [Actinomycetota bacterium]
MRRDVTFASQGVDCAGWLFVPDDLPAGQPAPAVVMANAFSATKEIYLSNHAERFAAAGFVVLAFDYRTFGGSGGEPRSQIFPHDQVDDLRNAVSWLGTQPEVDPDRIGAWGVSLGGGHVMFLSAFDKRIKAVVAMIPAINQWENFLVAMPKEAFIGFLGMLTADRQLRYTSGQVNYMQLVAPPGQMGLMPNEAYEFYTEAQRTVAPTWANQITMESLEKFSEYDPTGPIHLVSPTPLLMIVAEQDQIIPAALASAAFERAGEPK